MRNSLWLAIGFAALALVGCQQEAVNTAVKQRPKMYRTAISLSPSATEILGVKFMNIRLVGRTASCNYPKGVEQVPVVMNGVKPNYEKALAANPDVVVYDADLLSEADVAKFKENQIDVFAIGGTTVKEYVKDLYILGAAFAGETKVTDYVGDIERAESAAAGAKPATAPKVAVMVPDSRGAHLIAGSKSFVADVVRIAGGQIVGPDSARFELLSAENFLTWNPDLIVCSPKYEWILNDARFQSLGAIKQFKLGKPTIAQFNGDVLMRRGARVDQFIARMSDFVSGKMAQ